MIGAYASQIIMGGQGLDPAATCADYVDTVDENIREFMRARRRSRTMELEACPGAFARAWGSIGAEGDLSGAVAEFKVLQNASHD